MHQARPKLNQALRILLILFTGCGLLTCSITPLSSDPKQTDVVCLWGEQKFNLCKYDSHEKMVEALLAEMTLDEKIGQMTQSVWHNGVSPEVIRQEAIGAIIHTEGPVPGDLADDWVRKFEEFQWQALQTRLGIPLLIGVDAIHGQNTFEGAVIFPHNIGMAATRNLSLIQRAAEITAIETAGTGFNWTFSPCIAMPQHEHWGRVYEGFTEDRDLTIAAVSASVRGHQGESLAARHTVAATAKHYIADGATQGGIEGGDAVMSDQTMRELYLPPYARAVEDGVAAIMAGFNSYNGVNMHQNGYLVNEVLKGELGFQGVVLTDWNGGLRFGPAHTVINAGIDMAMQPGNHEEFMADLKSSVLDKTVAISRIDDAVRRILRLKFKLGLFADPFAKTEFSALVGSHDHRAVARQAVRESLVLLKSENSMLPLKPEDRIAVVGTHGNNSGLQSGGWTIHWQGQKDNYRGATTIVDGIRAVAPQTEYAEAGCYEGMAAEKVVAVVGEEPYAEFKGDTDQLFLNEAQSQIVQHCKALGKQVAVVLISGRVLAIEPELNLSDAFIAAWLPGSEGAGVADFLFATDGFRPTGKSPYAWPRGVEDLPLTQQDDRALFKFGFGLQSF
ncbi:MAG: glycosyl hydrolase [Xanthomonadales bacterium]|nr:glycoside hydrolase family 3 C-terminal domain-containing protein [Gammaproteobacteria bacterium]NNK52335.1 glycosyl hydrolase [Xanthomonadales bacterium]